MILVHAVAGRNTNGAAESEEEEREVRLSDWEPMDLCFSAPNYLT